MTLYRLFLGSKRGDAVIPAAEVERFITRVVSPVLNGYTRYVARGYWRGTSEPAEVIEYLGDDTEGTRATIRGIARLYAAQFGQESVLLLMSKVSAEYLRASAELPMAA